MPFNCWRKTIIISGRSSKFFVGKPLDFHDTIFQDCLVFLKYNSVVEILNKVVLHH